MALLRNMVVSCFDEKGYKEGTEALKGMAFNTVPRRPDGET